MFNFYEMRNNNNKVYRFLMNFGFLISNREGCNEIKYNVHDTMMLVKTHSVKQMAFFAERYESNIKKSHL